MNAIQHDVTIKGSAHDIFSAITTAKGLNAWWTLEAAGELSVGAEFVFFFGSEWDWRAEVLEFNIDEKVTFRMKVADSDWVDTILSFSILITEDVQTSILRFEHSAWKECNDHFRRTSYCWALYLRGLKRYVELGVTVPYSERTF